MRNNKWEPEQDTKPLMLLSGKILKEILMPACSLVIQPTSNKLGKEKCFKTLKPLKQRIRTKRQLQISHDYKYKSFKSFQEQDLEELKKLEKFLSQK